MTTIRRFAKKVDFSRGCWEWTASRSHNGYGAFGVNGKVVRAHRFVAEMIYGPLPESTQVCHSCDNRACVRPDHLFLGFARDNTNDMMQKGRNVTPAKLNADAVQRLREMYASGLHSQREVARCFGITQGQVSRIVRCLAWTPKEQQNSGNQEEEDLRQEAAA